ncbi:MAG: hypothetical protein ABSB25_11305 [Sedimentisphaerales bacterium]
MKLAIGNKHVPFWSPPAKLVISSKSHSNARAYDNNCRVSMTKMVGYWFMPYQGLRRNRPT